MSIYAAPDALLAALACRLFSGRYSLVTFTALRMEHLKAVKLFLIGLLQVVCLLFLVELAYNLYKLRVLVCIQCTRLAIWALALVDTITLMVYTAKWPEHG
jgi:hypothetical protein